MQVLIQDRCTPGADTLTTEKSASFVSVLQVIRFQVECKFSQRGPFAYGGWVENASVAKYTYANEQT